MFLREPLMAAALFSPAPQHVNNKDVFLQSGASARAEEETCFTKTSAAKGGPK